MLHALATATPRHAAKRAAWLIALTFALSLGSIGDAVAQDVADDLGPVWVCFDGRDGGPPPEVLEKVNAQIAEYMSKYNLAGRWPGGQGSPTALTWSFMPDGVNIPQSNNFDEPQQGALPSNLFASFDANFPNRATWVNAFQASFNRWQALTGITFTRVTSGGNPWDDGAAWATAGDGVNRGDIRIGGRCIDGSGGTNCAGNPQNPGNTLAYNQFPGNGGDMVMDTADNFSSGGTELFLRNTVTHELGHGIGLFHTCPINQTKLMEPNINTVFDGPQHDDIRAGQVHYGDPSENDNSSGTSANLGALNPASPFNLGAGDFPAPAVANGSNHSIDANGEQDYYSFSVSGAELLDVSLNPIGLNYDSSTQQMNGNCNSGNFINSNNMADLAFDIIDTDGSTVMTTVDGQGLGGTETVTDFNLPAAGTYFVRVFESNSPTQSQSYGMTMDVNQPPVAQCKPFAASADASCCITVDVSDVDDGSFDPNGAGDIASIAITEVDGIFVGSQASVEICGDGMHTVELTITDDSGLTDTCEANVEVIDDTAPILSCPTSIVVECSEAGGTPATDPLIAAFLGGFSATDNCDDNPVLANDAPLFFPLGVTAVTFTATDENGNSDSCVRNVEVEDTIPPVLTVDLNRYAMWPPNHKMVDISATVEVTDICDPNPTFVLTSIVSSEPDNDNGDGSTNDDIQGAAFDTPDTEFQLRSERDGRKGGRTYSITYTAMDVSMNETVVVVEVRVVHDKGVMSKLSGVTPDGARFQPNAQIIQILVSSTEAATDLSIATFNGDGIRESIKPPAYDFNASRVDHTRAYVGNTAGVAVPVTTAILDADGDGLRDLLLTYDQSAVDALVELSTIEDGPVGLYYQSIDGEDHLLPDIFALQEWLKTDEIGRRHTGELGEDESLDIAGINKPDRGFDEPVETGIGSIHPNPFNPLTTISFHLREAQPVTLKVYNLRGAVVRTLLEGVQSSGTHRVVWDGRDDTGSTLASGVYVMLFATQETVEKRKLTLVK